MTAYVRPADLAEATRALADHPDWMILAGGTDLMVHAPHQPVPVGILDLWRLPELGGVDARTRAMIDRGCASAPARPGARSSPTRA